MLLVRSRADAAMELHLQGKRLEITVDTVCPEHLQRDPLWRTVCSAYAGYVRIHVPVDSLSCLQPLTWEVLGEQLEPTGHSWEGPDTDPLRIVVLRVYWSDDKSDFTEDCVSDDNLKRFRRKAAAHSIYRSKQELFAKLPGTVELVRELSIKQPDGVSLDFVFAAIAARKCARVAMSAGQLALDLVAEWISSHLAAGYHNAEESEIRAAIDLHKGRLKASMEASFERYRKRRWTNPPAWDVMWSYKLQSRTLTKLLELIKADVAKAITARGATDVWRS